MDPDNVYLTLLAELAFALGITLLMVSVILRRYIKAFNALRLKYKELKRQVKVGSTLDRKSETSKDPSFLGQPIQYIKRQLSKTRDRQDSPAENTSNDQVWQLRKQFLEAEKSALTYKEGSDAYWQDLDKSLQNILQFLITSEASPQEVTHWEEKVNLLRERINKLKEASQNQRALEAKLFAANETISHLKTKQNGNLKQSSLEKINQMNQRLKCTGTDGLVINNHSDTDSFRSIRKSNLKGLADAELIDNNHKRQREIILDLKAKIRELEFQQVGNSDNPIIPDSLKNQIQLLEEQLERSESYASALNSELLSIKQKLNEAQHNLDVSENRLSQNDQEFWRKGKQQNYSDALIISNSPASVEERIDQIVETKRCYEKASDDINEVNNVIEYQRKTINGLEDEIGNLRKELLSAASPEESEAKAKIIERLEQLLKESETCVTMLETEVDSLKEKLDELSQQIDIDQKDINKTYENLLQQQHKSNTENDVNEELNNMAEMLNNTMNAYGDQSSITHFAMNCIKCRDLNELARDIMGTIGTFGVDPALSIRSKLGTIETFDKSKISPRDKQQLRAIVFDEKNRITDINGGFIITFPNLSLLIKSAEKSEETITRTKDLFVSMLSLASNAIDKIEGDHICERQQKTLDTLLRSTQKTIKNLDIQYTYQCDEATQINNRLLKELYLALESMNITKNQRKIFESMMNDSQERMALLFASGLTVDKTMKKLIEKLDNKTS